VFEIVKTAGGYASTPTTLVDFNGADGAGPEGSLIADANGDLFGTTSGGTVFEIVKTAGGYARTPATLVSFNGTNGDMPRGSLIADSDGDLFGTTAGGGANDDDGTVFEIARSDNLLWQNTNGQSSIWDMNGNTLAGGGPVSANPGPSWKAIGMGEFFGGGSSDILWQNTTSGQASIWEMNGSTIVGGGPVSADPGPSWRAVGVGDFTDDGQPDDILWQNTSAGQASIWEMSGNTLAGGGAVSPNPGPAWKAIGTGDFTGHGQPDVILWQNTSTGQVSIWEMDGNTLMGGGPVTPNPGPSWKAIGTGDFNHDGFSDILFQNASTGQVSIWEMNGNTLKGGGPVSPNPGPSWHAIGTDGGSDILFQNTSGQASIWDMSGTSLVGGGPVSPNPGPSWRAVDLT
jgi:VCBS repeat protein